MINNLLYKYKMPYCGFQIINLTAVDYLSEKHGQNNFWNNILLTIKVFML